MTASRPLKTLLVEDDPALADLTLEMLEITGCDVVAASSPEEAVKLLEAERDFELLFTDYLFPGGVTGVKLAEQASEITPGIKVIVASGMDQATINADSSNQYQTLQKPYWMDDIKKRLTQLFS